jgi:hypothetical protein
MKVKIEVLLLLLLLQQERKQTIHSKDFSIYRKRVPSLAVIGLIFSVKTRSMPYDE